MAHVADAADGRAFETTAADLLPMERNIARCRMVLSLAAILVVYIDPETPLLSRWVPFVSGRFMVDARLLAVMATHVVYSIAVYGALHAGRAVSPRLLDATVWADVLFAVAVTTMTEGVTGPSYPFFAFAVVASGLRGGFRHAMRVTVASLGLYSCLIFLSTRESADVWVMRPVYLGITGYLVSYLGQQRLELQEQMRRLEIAEQRHRIARDLHDGYAQALAGITLRLEGARRLLRADGADEVLGDLTDLQESVNREYDDLRRYARSLAGVDATPTAGDAHDATLVSLHATVSGPIALVDHVLGIAREGLSNVRRHACARTASIDIEGNPAGVRISLDDDGVGCGGAMPWSIASRVKEIGGAVEIAADHRPGAHVLITVPRA
jgi:signal transduction histidine kinase